MNKKDFGQLVATLRKEARNEFDEPLTQYDLAELTRIPLITLQKVEQGRQENIKPEILLKLAKALNISSRARQIFFLASLGLKDSETVKPSATPELVLAELIRTLAQLQTPAFILDGFGDILALNLSFLAVYHLETSQLLAPQLLSQYNLIRFLFSSEFDAQRARLEETQFDFTRQVIQLFRLWTLKRRNHWYFQRLLPELNRYPGFREHWQSPAFQNEDLVVQYTYLTLKHPELGRLKFLLGPIQAISTQGDLYIFSLQPLETQTADVCRQLAHELGTQPIPLASWPKPFSPTEAPNGF